MSKILYFLPFLCLISLSIVAQPNSYQDYNRFVEEHGGGMMDNMDIILNNQETIDELDIYKAKVFVNENYDENGAKPKLNPVAKIRFNSLGQITQIKHTCRAAATKRVIQRSTLRDGPALIGTTVRSVVAPRKGNHHLYYNRSNQVVRVSVNVGKRSELIKRASYDSLGNIKEYNTVTWSSGYLYSPDTLITERDSIGRVSTVYNYEYPTKDYIITEYNYIDLSEEEDVEAVVNEILSTRSRLTNIGINKIMVYNDQKQLLEEMTIRWKPEPFIFSRDTYKYDENGRVVNKERMVRNKIILIENWMYNNEGLVLTYLKRVLYQERDYETNYKYNQDGQITQLKEVSENKKGTQRIESEKNWEYNKNGLLVKKIEHIAGHHRWNGEDRKILTVYKYL